MCAEKERRAEVAGEMGRVVGTIGSVVERYDDSLMLLAAFLLSSVLNSRAFCAFAQDFRMPEGSNKYILRVCMSHRRSLPIVIERRF